MSDEGRFAFEPLLGVAHGRPVGMEIRRRQSRDQAEHIARSTVWGARQLAEFDAGIAIASVLYAAEHEATVPLHVDVLADTVVAARARLLHLSAVLRERKAAAPPIVLEIGPAIAAAPADALADGVAALRAAGFGIALDAAARGFGPALIAEIAPDLVKFEAGLVTRLPADAAARAVARAMVEVCAAVGVRTAATGVARPEELAAIRELEIAWAQGPLLAPVRRRPDSGGLRLPPLLTALPPIPAAPQRRRTVAPPTLGDVAHAPIGLPSHATAEQVRRAFADHPQAGSVLLLDAAGRPTGFLDRNRFMLAISGPFGRALYAERPASGLADQPRTAEPAMTVRDALRRCLDGDRRRSYDDLVVVDGAGVCAGVVRMTDLLQVATAGSAA